MALRRGARSRTMRAGVIARMLAHLAQSVSGPMRGQLEAQNTELEAQQVTLQHALGELAERKRRVEASHTFVERLSEEPEVEPLGRIIVAGLCEFAGADTGVLMTVEGERDPELFPVAAHGSAAGAWVAAPAASAARRRAIALRRGVAAPSPQAELSLGSGTPVRARHELHLPLLLGGRAIGVVSLARLGERVFTAAERSAIEHLVDQSAASLSNALLLDRTREQAAIMRTVLEATPDAIGLFDLDAQPLLENAPMKRIRAALERGPGFGLAGGGLERERDELELLEPKRTFQRYGAPVRDGSGAFIGRIVVLRDMTAERESDRLKDEFFALVSHELRTPLTSVLGYLDLVCTHAGERLSEEDQHFLSVAQRNARRLLRLVTDLLFVAQFESGKLALDPVAVDLAGLAREAVEAAGPRARAQDLTLSLDADPVPSSAGDPDRLAQAFDNLISNAIKFTPRGGRVDVRVRVRGDVARIEFQDTGVGIPAEEQQLLFQRFFRATTATEHAIQGIGLGLAIVKAIVEGHGGRIAVESERGTGTTFALLLPLRTPPAVVRRIHAPWTGDPPVSSPTGPGAST